MQALIRPVWLNVDAQLQLEVTPRRVCLPPGQLLSSL